MKRRFTCALSFFFVAALLAAGAAPLRSGPQVGETLPGSFEVQNCNGPDAGDTNCLV